MWSYLLLPSWFLDESESFSLYKINPRSNGVVVVAVQVKFLRHGTVLVHHKKKLKICSLIQGEDLKAKVFMI